MARIKICGITNIEDALLSVELGADMLGFNFYERSPRYISRPDARVIIDKLPITVDVVGVFVNAEAAAVASTAQTAGLTAVQLHGTETPVFVSELRKIHDIPVIKAFRVSRAFRSDDILEFDVDAILLDAYSPALFGGTGESFDWEIAKQVQRIFPKMYLAGGLSPDNVRTAVAEVKPFAVDACSSLEMSPGKKDPEKLRQFIVEAKRDG